MKQPTPKRVLLETVEDWQIILDKTEDGYTTLMVVAPDGASTRWASLDEFGLGQAEEWPAGASVDVNRALLYWVTRIRDLA